MDIRWGIIGCGNVTEVKSGPAFRHIEGSSLVAVMRRNAALARDYAKRHGVKTWYSDADKLIADPAVDAVYIATPVGSHLEYALKVARAGKPAYVEKPMARNTAEARLMVDAFTRAGLKLFVAYYRRRLPRFLKAKSLIESGKLGTITGFDYHYSEPRRADLNPSSLPWRFKAQEAGGGLVMDLGCHTIDIIDFLLGPVENVSGEALNTGSPYDVEDRVVMTFTAGGILGTADWNFSGSFSSDLLRITGTEGELEVSTFGTDPVMYCRHGETGEFDLPNPPHIQQPLIESIIGELTGRDSCPSTGESAIRTTMAIDAALDGYYGGRQRVFWEDPASWPGRGKRRENYGS